MPEEAREQESKFTDQMWGWRNTVADKVLGLFPRRTAEHLVNAQRKGSSRCVRYWIAAWRHWKGICDAFKTDLLVNNRSKHIDNA